MNEPLIEKLKYLRLGGLLAHWEDYLKMAAEQRFSQARLLTHVVEEEYRLRRENARQLRLKRAHLSEPWVLETFPFERQPKLNKKRLLALYDTLSFLKNHENIIWLGRTGCGKTGLATSFLVHVINQGYTARSVLFAELVAQLYRSVADHSEAEVLKGYLACDCLLVDEIGYIEVEPVQAGLFFNLMQKRHKKKSTLITSNLGFSDWGSFLKNAHLTAALVDRLTENSHVFNMKECIGLREPIQSDHDPDPKKG